ncbi:MAG: hypothetical protein NT003_03430 [Candidatus Magasanikbacteria bacterium]|nr:hypothetical protein [Candidatus Magasanikbacteria bacterium]
MLFKTGSGALKVVAGILLALIVLLGIFQLGLFVGYRKAKSSYDWADSYRGMMSGRNGGRGGMMRSGFMRQFRGDDFSNGQGVAGSVVKMSATGLVVTGADGIEIIVNGAPRTIIVSGRDAVKLTDVKVGEIVVVMGAPERDGSIDATIIRLMGIAPTSATGTATTTTK